MPSIEGLQNEFERRNGTERPAGEQQSSENMADITVHRNHEAGPTTTENAHENNPDTEGRPDHTEHNEILNRLPEKTEGRFAGIKSFFSRPNQSLFERLSTKAKDIAYGIYEKIKAKFSVTNTNNIFAKIEIYQKSQFMKHHEGKAAENTVKIKEMDTLIESLQEENTQLEQDIQQASAPDRISLEKTLGSNIEKISTLKNKRDNFFKDWQSHDGKMAQNAERRNDAAEQMMADYEAPLKQLTDKLKSLKKELAEIKSKIAGLEALRATADGKIADLEAQKAEKLKRCAGFNYSKITKAALTRRFDNDIIRIRKNMQSYEKSLKHQKLTTNLEISKVKEKLNPVLNKYNEYARVTHRQPFSAGFEDLQIEDAEVIDN